MTKLELLNVFLNDRLTAAAEDIFRAIKETVAEYQSEILRSKEENDRLKRLLNVAVQRLLLQPEAHSIQAQEDAPACEPEWRGSAEPTQVKEEPELRNLQNEGRTSSSLAEAQVETPQRSHLKATQTVCHIESVSPPPTVSRDVKAESDGEGNRKCQATNSVTSSLTVNAYFRAAPSDDRAQSDQIQRRENLPGSDRPQTKGPPLSNGKQSAHILRIKNVRSLKSPPPRPSRPVQGIQKWHCCEQCGKGFSFACQLEVHMRWHTKEKPYSCAVCRKSFTTVSMLKRHHRIHTGEKPFRCHVCGKCFNQSAHLNTHFRLHTGERARWSRGPHPK